MLEIFFYFNLYIPNTCLFRTQKLVPERFGLDLTVLITCGLGHTKLIRPHEVDDFVVLELC